MSKKVTQKDLLSILKALYLVDDITFYNNISPHTERSDRWYQNIGNNCLDKEIDRLDKDDNEILEKLELLMEYLGLEIANGRRIVKINKTKKGKK